MLIVTSEVLLGVGNASSTRISLYHEDNASWIEQVVCFRSLILLVTMTNSRDTKIPLQNPNKTDLKYKSGTCLLLNCKVTVKKRNFLKK